MVAWRRSSTLTTSRAYSANMAELSGEDCLAILRTMLEPTIGYLRTQLQKAIELDAADSQKTEAFLDEDRDRDSTEADVESGSYT